MNVAEHIILMSSSAAPSVAALMLAAETQGLAIDFTALSMAIKDTTTPANNFDGDPNSKLTYSSPSTKWVLGANGLYSSGTTLRTSYDTSGNKLGVLIEEARTNLLLQSQTFSNASWSKVNATVSAAAAVSPDGSTNASKLVEDAITNVHNTQQAIVKAASAIQYTFSGFVKAAERTWVELFVFDGAADGQRQYVNLSTGAAGNATAQGAGFTGVSFASSLRPDGWVYFAWTFTTNTATALQCRVYTASANGTDNYAGDGTSGIYLWNMQLEAGAFATSLIVTAGSTVTRAADNINLSCSLFPSLGSAGTMFAAGRTFTGNTATSYALELFTDGSNFSAIRNDSGATAQAVVFTGGALVAAPVVANWAAATQRKVALRVNTNNTNICSGGTLGTNDVTCAMPAYATMYIGSNNGVGNFNGFLSQIMALPRAMLDAEMQTVTT